MGLLVLRALKLPGRLLYAPGVVDVSRLAATSLYITRHLHTHNIVVERSLLFTYM